MIENKHELSQHIINIISSLQQDPSDWVDFARIGAPLTAANIQYKAYGFAKLRPFLNEFSDVLEFGDVIEEGKPPVCYVRPKVTLEADSFNEEEASFSVTTANETRPQPVIHGRILWIVEDEQYKFKGAIEAENQKKYSFNATNWINQTLTAYDIHTDDEVEFELKPPNRNNIVFPKRIRFRGEGAHTETQTAPYYNHSHGEFRRFVYLKLPILKIAFINIMGGIENWDASFNEIVLKKIVSSYAELHDSDFIFDEDNGTLIFPSGFQKGEEKIFLHCTKNYDPEKSEWYCDHILYDGKIIGGSVFDIMNANWYDILSDLQKVFKLGQTDDLSSSDINVKSMIEKIELRCMKDAPFVWLKDGFLSDEETADKLYIPTGYTVRTGEELYLCCSYREGYGWYYDCVTYENAPLEVYDKKDWLELWSEFDWESFFRIANMTLEEKWSFGDRNDFGILRNQLVYTFAHQWSEDAVRFSDNEKYAAFNTGFPDSSTYQYIYAFYEKIESNDLKQVHPLFFAPKYRFKNFVINYRGGDGKILKDNIHPLPPPPRFFKARSSTVWELEFDDNNQISMPGFDDTHILIHRCDRIPIDFYRSIRHTSEKLSNILNNPQTTDRQKYKEIREFFLPIYNQEDRADEDVIYAYHALYERLKSSIDKAVKKLSWNWRSVIPCYNPEREEQSFLLPVSFCNPSRPDRALVATASCRNGKIDYNIHTVLRLEWAYLDARLVCRPESEWLAADIIR